MKSLSRQRIVGDGILERMETIGLYPRRVCEIEMTGRVAVTSTAKGWGFEQIGLERS